MHPDFAGGAYDETSFWSSRFGALLFDHLEIRRNVRGLDVGCATGFPLFELAHVHGPSSHFTGIDTWGDALVRARRKLAVYGDTNVELIEADAASMPFADESFDLITSNLGINNFADVPRSMAECYRVARPGARIVLTTNVSGHMASFYDVFREVAPELTDKIDAQEAHRGTRASVEALLTTAGFRLTQTVEREFAMPFADGTALFRHHLVQFFLEGWRTVTNDDAVFARIEERLNASGGELRFRIPMLYVEAVRP